MQKTTRIPKFSSLPIAQTKIVTPTRKTGKSAILHYDLLAKARKIVDLFLYLKVEKHKKNEYDKCKDEFVPLMAYLRLEDFEVRGTEWTLKLKTTKKYTFSNELEVLRKELKTREQEEIDNGIASVDITHHICPIRTGG